MSDSQGSPGNFNFGIRRLVLVDSAGSATPALSQR